MPRPPPPPRKTTPGGTPRLTKQQLELLQKEAERLAKVASGAPPASRRMLEHEVEEIRARIAEGSLPPTPNAPRVVAAPPPDTSVNKHVIWQKWAALGVSLVVALGGGGFFMKGCSNKEEIDKLNGRVEKCEQNVSQLYNHARSVKKSEESYRRANGAAWRKHPVGEVILEGVLQNGRVESESLSPPVTRVKERVEPYPPVPTEK